ncbi:hypothetical protein [Methyloceanibacter marginalis]|uniref:hypothetical protein n=1 Tax=Methyloceanibacter marginalis TaxID=1774971 RepID=UPI001301523B|nr:hypothetical protein [Methyloceanibacter marginalis]
MDSPQSPINPVSGIIPGDLQDFSSAASRVTRQQIDEQDPLNTNDILTRVPGATSSPTTAWPVTAVSAFVVRLPGAPARCS